MDDDKIVALGAYAIFSAGIVTEDCISTVQAVQLSALILGHVRAPETLALVGASVAYPGRTKLCENAIRGVMRGARREANEESIEMLAMAIAKL